MGKFLVVMLAVLVAAMSMAVGEEICGTIHFHSAYSDGERTPSVLRSVLRTYDNDFFVVTDHAEQINITNTGIKKNILFVGYDKYIDDFVGGKPYGIVGTEVQFQGADYPSHTLVFGEKEKMRDFFSKDLPVDPLRLVELVKSCGLLTVAAHPHQKDYPYDTIRVHDVDGVEFFNDDGANRYACTIVWYMKLLKEGRHVFVTSGCDSHTSLDVTQSDRNRWTRKTWISCDEVSEAGILAAFRAGRTIATCNGARLSDLSYWPSFSCQEAKDPTFHCRVTFPRPVSSSKEVRVYCDGKLLEGSVKTFPKGAREMAYDWSPVSGEHSYVIEVEQCIVTSPIYLRYQPVSNVVKKDQNYNDWYPQLTCEDGYIVGKRNTVAFLSDRDGKIAVWIKHLPSGRLKKAVELTDDEIPQFSIDTSSEILLMARNGRLDFVDCVTTWDEKGKGTKRWVRRKIRPELRANPVYCPTIGCGVCTRVEFCDSSDKLQWAIKRTGEKDDPEAEFEFFGLRTGSRDKISILTSRKDGGVSRLCLLDGSFQFQKWLTPASYSCGLFDLQETAVPFTINSHELMLVINKGTGENVYTAYLEDNGTIKNFKQLTKDGRSSEPCMVYDCFCSNIYYVCVKDGRKRIWSMNEDGSDKKPLDMK